jgi:hypothetical protein
MAQIACKDESMRWRFGLTLQHTNVGRERSLNKRQLLKFGGFGKPIRLQSVDGTK